MLVAITSEGLDSSFLVAEKFGRTPFIIFYDTEKNTFESFRNPYVNLFGGAGIQISQLIIEKNAGAVITVDIGLNPLRLFKSADVKVYSCSAKQVAMVVNEFMEEKLPIVELGTDMNFGKKRRGKKGRNWNKNI
ncbi:MAG: NifB/NifX family molybdenum-iron cluster-binding protein [Candidatus Doudnabacteria bacterium]